MTVVDALGWMAGWIGHLGSRAIRAAGVIAVTGVLAWPVVMMMRDEQIGIAVRRTSAGAAVRVIVAGELDEVTIGSLSAELELVLAQQFAEVEVDLSAVTFFSIAAARALWNARERSAGQLTVVGAGQPIRKLLDILHWQALLTSGWPSS